MGWRLASPRSESRPSRPTRQPAEQRVRDRSPAWAVGKSKRKNALREREKPGKAYEGRDPPESCFKLLLPRTRPVALVALDRCPALVRSLGTRASATCPDDGRPCDGAATALVSHGRVSGAGSRGQPVSYSRHLTSCVHSVSAHTYFTRRSDGAPTP